MRSAVGISGIHAGEDVNIRTDSIVMSTFQTPDHFFLGQDFNRIGILQGHIGGAVKIFAQQDSLIHVERFPMRKPNTQDYTGAKKK